MIQNYNVQLNRKVRVFISSTFEDMIQERDIIVNSIFPRLRREFRSRFIDIMEVDLRWGIPDDDIESCNILEICIEQVRKSHYFMGILGNRYGTPAKDSEISSLPPYYRKAIGEDIPKGISITELEMRAGVFVPQEKKPSYFFIRKGISGNIPEDAVLRLLEQIRAEYDTYVYNDLESFESYFYNTLRSYLEHRFPEELIPPYNDGEYFSHLRILQQNTSRYIKNDSFIETYQKICATQRKVYVLGEKGSGKSAFMSFVAKKTGVDNDEDVFFHFATADGGSMHIEEIYYRLRLYLTQLTGHHSLLDDDADADLEILPFVKRKLTLFFDAVEQYNDPTAIYKLFAYADMNPCVSVVCSGTNDYEALKREEVLLMCRLNEEQIRQIVLRDLQLFGKTLSKEDLNRIVTNPMCSNPLFLQAVVSQLRTYGDRKSFDSFFDKLLKADTFNGLFSIIIERIVAYYNSRNFDSELIYRALALIVYSNQGISETELQEILHFIPVARSVLISTIEKFIIEENGLIRFNHDLIISAATNVLASKDIDFSKLSTEILINYFQSAEDSWRKFSELPYQLNKARDFNRLTSEISKPDCFQFLIMNEFYALAGYLAATLDNQMDILNSLIDSPVVSNKIKMAEVLCYGGCYYATIELANHVSKLQITVFERVRLMDLSARSIYKLGQNNFNDAIRAYQDLVHFYAIHYPDDSIGYASRAYLLGVAYKSSGKIATANKLLSQCAAIFMENNVISATAAWVLDVFGEALFSEGKLKESEKATNRALNVCSLISGKYSLEAAWAYCYGWPCLYSLGELNRAAKMVRLAYDIYYKYYLGHGTKLAWAALNAGTVALVTRDFTRAEELYLFSIRENDVIVRPEFRPHVYSLTAYCNLACLYEYQGNHVRAMETIEFARINSVLKNGSMHLYTANIYLTYGIISKQVDYIEKAITIFKSNDPDMVDIYFAEVCLSRVLSMIGQCDESERVIRDCSKRYFKRRLDTAHIDYLIYDTLDKISGEMNEDMVSYARYAEYRFYLTHNNNSNIIIIPRI